MNAAAEDLDVLKMPHHGSPYSSPEFLTAVVGDGKVQAQVAKLLGDQSANMTAAELGQRFLNDLQEMFLGEGG